MDSPIKDGSVSKRNRYDSDSEKDSEKQKRRKSDKKSKKEHKTHKSHKSHKEKKRRDSDEDNESSSQKGGATVIKDTSYLDDKRLTDINEIKDVAIRSDFKEVPLFNDMELTTTSINEIKAAATSVSREDFFANLMSLERLKPSVGTIHNTVKKAELDKKTGSWNCPKCSTSNFNNSHQCHKCKAIKRMTEYR
jgi:hypothetical protein